MIELDANDQETSGDFETKLRKIEALKKDSLLSEDEYKQTMGGNTQSKMVNQTIIRKVRD